MQEFEKKFNNFYPTLKRIARRFSKTTPVPYEEFESSLCEEFFVKYEDFIESRNSSFSGYMRVRLTQRAIREAKRSEGKFYRGIEYIETRTFINEDGDEVVEDFEDNFDLEKHVVECLYRKTDADKRQLINALSENADPDTKRIVSEYLRSDDARPTAIGKALGIHHQTVIRKLKYLSREFDENKFGELDAYLAS